MTAFIAQLIVAWLLLIVLFASAHALAGMAFGVEVLEVSIGMGKALFSRGKLRLRAIPLGGYVKLADTRENPPLDPSAAFDHKPRHVQVLIYLMGCAATVLLATLLLASAGLSEVGAGFRQLIVGAFAPTSTAQEYIRATHRLWVSQGFLALLGVIAAKVAAMNLLPLPLLNGGQAILALAGFDQVDRPGWLTTLMNLSVLLLFALMSSWAFAIVIFATGAAGP